MTARHRGPRQPQRRILPAAVREQSSRQAPQAGAGDPR